MARRGTNKWSASSPDDFPREVEYGLWAEPYDKTVKRRVRYDGPIEDHTYTVTGLFTKLDSMSLVKRDISANANRNSGVTTRSHRVYENHGGEWIETYHLPVGTVTKKHPLWKNGKAPTGPQATAEVDVDEAIASIQALLERG